MSEYEDYSPTEYDQLRSEGEDLDQKQSDLLTRKGWKHTSNTPGCYWVWYKDTKRYGRLMGDASLAFSMQENLDAFYDG